MDLHSVRTRLLLYRSTTLRHLSHSIHSVKTAAHRLCMKLDVINELIIEWNFIIMVTLPMWSPLCSPI